MVPSEEQEVLRAPTHTPPRLVRWSGVAMAGRRPSVGTFARTGQCPARHGCVGWDRRRRRRTREPGLTGLLPWNVGCGRPPASRLQRGLRCSVPSRPPRWEDAARTAGRSFPCVVVGWLLTWKKPKKGVMRRGVCGGRRPRGRQTGSCSSESLPPRSEASLSFPPSWGPASRREQTLRNASQLIQVYVPSDPVNTPWWCSPLCRRVGRTGRGHHCRPTAG